MNTHTAARDTAADSNTASLAHRRRLTARRAAVTARLTYLRDSLQFDASTLDRAGYSITVRCTCCAALVINGTPAHETGCPHITRTCKGCNARIPARAIYCAECR